MKFLTPLAFALAALAPIIIALYFLKLRRTEQRVSSTYLWRALVRDTAANAPWQRLKPNLLLFLQLLFLAVLIFALARPFMWSDRVSSPHLILVVDTSASMSATDSAPNRLANAVMQARGLIQSLTPTARVTLIDAGAQARVPLASATDRSAAFAALDVLHAGLGGSDMASALTLANAMAASEPDAQVVILSDGNFTLPENFALPPRAQFLSIGSSRANQALSAFTLQAEGGGQSRAAFLQIVNYDDQPATRRLVLRDELGQLLTARDLMLPPHKSHAVTFPNLPATVNTLQAQLEGADAFAHDDRGWAVAPARDKTQVRLVTTGNRFFETALNLMPNVGVTLSKPEELGGAPAASELTILDSVVPTATLPAGNLLFIAPPRATEFFSVTGSINAPQPVAVAPDDPLLRYVDAHEVAIQDASRVELPGWGRAVWTDRTTGAPLLIIGEVQGRRLAVLAFDMRHSDLPLRVGFPILLANLLDALVPGGAAGIPTNVAPGRPIVIPATLDTKQIAVRAPDGTTVNLTPAQGRVVFDDTNQPGVYEWRAAREGGGDERGGRFAVNSFNAQESDIAPRATLTAATATETTTGEPPRARSEWWQPLAWLALVVLVIEWLVAYRGQVARVLLALKNLKGLPNPWGFRDKRNA